MKHIDYYEIDDLIAKIVKEKGGFREKDILFNHSNHYHFTETWNDEHKVVNIISNFEDDDGHCDSFSVDIVTGRICG